MKDMRHRIILKKIPHLNTASAPHPLSSDSSCFGSLSSTPAPSTLPHPGCPGEYTTRKRGAHTAISMGFCYTRTRNDISYWKCRLVRTAGTPWINSLQHHSTQPWGTALPHISLCCDSPWRRKQSTHTFSSSPSTLLPPAKQSWLSLF